MGRVVLRDYQERVLERLRDGIRAGRRAQMLYLPTGGGKCLGRGTPVMLADGRVVPVEAVRSGDLLLGPDGTPRNVLSTTQGLGRLYRITPTKGDPYVVNADHILSLRRTPGDAFTLADGSRVERDDDIVSVNVEVFAASGPTARAMLKGWRSDPIDQFPGRRRERLGLDPYWLGMWLGDGRSNGTQIAKPDCNMVAWMKRHAEERGHVVTNYEKRDGKCPAWGIANLKGDNVYMAGLRQYALIGDKHIPDAFKFASLKNRLQLLAGMMDSDGCVSRTGFDWITEHSRLAFDLAFVCRSAGLSAYVSECRKSIKSIGFAGTYWRLSISGECDRIPTLDKHPAPREQIKRHRVHGIRVEAIGEGDYFGFTLDGDKLFLLGDFTVTHNTECAIALMQSAHEKERRSAMILDRIVLCNQTSARLQKYSLDHGVMQSGHWRYRSYERIQVCSAQTLEKRGTFPGLSLLVIDEAHNTRKATVEFIKNNPEVVVVGLSASPFTDGLDAIYAKEVVSAATTAELVSWGSLVPLRVFIAREVNMDDKKPKGGEWTVEDAADAGMKITGDVVTEWRSKCFEVFGGPRKTIVFCASVAHGADLARQFAEAGFNFVQISYQDSDEFKAEAVKDFSRPDTEIHGLIACDILTKGFDVPDVMVGVSVRPFKKSFSSHVQQMGRVMRPYPDKKFALWLDHSGNYLRFLEDWDELYHEGVRELKDGREKPKAEKNAKEKERAKCPKCGSLWAGKSRVCTHCGFQRPIHSDIEEVAGEMVELKEAAANKAVKQQWYSELLRIAEDRQYSHGWVSHKYKEKFGVWPKNMRDEVAPAVSAEVVRWEKSRRIAFAKGKAKGATA